MTTLDSRERAIEGLYAHELDLLFQVNCRRDRLLAEWAAEQMGLSATETEAYVQRIVMIDCDAVRTAVHDTIMRDLRQCGVALSEHRLARRVDVLTRQAWEQVMRESPDDDPVES